MYYLASYHPLIMNRRGKRAAERFHIPPYVNASCRREPDFESRFPSITAICRGDKFAPRLRESDVVTYMTTKKGYPGYPQEHWRLTAVLQVIRKFRSHGKAATWYENNNVKLPNNCMVRNNPPVGLHRTSNADNYPTVEQWDTIYLERVKKTPVFLVCLPLYLELVCPPVLTEAHLFEAFGRLPATRNPPKITEDECRRLTSMLDIRHFK